MKLFALTLFLFTTLVYAHPMHNMIMLGEEEIFLSHIVYKVPHNYQVILKVKLNPEAKSKYLAAKRLNPKNLMILFLDHMDMGQMASATELTGTMLTEDPEGNRQEIFPLVSLKKGEFELVFFDELPLSLAK